jgi:hypothetical protein
MPTLAYYISGHGFGHARRSAQVLRTLAALRPDLRLIVRTSAPPVLFDNISNTVVRAPEQPFDPGVVEHDALSIDPAASLQRLEDVLRRRADLVRLEAEFLRRNDAKLVVADIPFLAGDAAQAARIACLAVGNFTWDWIFEPFATNSAARQMVEEIRQSYRKMDALLHLPLGHEVGCFKQVIEVPLLATRSQQDRGTTLGRLGLDPADARPRVLIAMRGGVSPDSLRRAAIRPSTFGRWTQALRSISPTS